MAAKTQYAFGVDVGGTTIKIGLYDVKKEDFIDKWEIPTRTQDNGRYILPDIAQALRDKLTEAGAEFSQVKGVGIGVPGPALENGVVNMAVNLHWGVVDVAKNLSELLDGLPVKVANDANVAALGEQWKGGGEGYQKLVMVTLGTGVGGGVILNGRILAGSNGAAGEIGHIKVSDTETDVCNCGKTGCLEQYTSANGVVRMTRKALAKNRRKTVLYDDETLNSKVIFDAIKDGDEFALSVGEDFGRYLGEAIAIINMVVDPEVVVIGGGMSKAGQVVVDLVQKYYTPAAFHATRNVVFKLAELGNTAGMYGAVRMVLQ